MLIQDLRGIIVWLLSSYITPIQSSLFLEPGRSGSHHRWLKRTKRQRGEGESM